MGVTDQGAREARYAEAVAAHADLDSAGLDGRRLTLAVMAVVDAEVAAAVSEAQAQVERLTKDLAANSRWLRSRTHRAEAAEATLRDLRQDRDEWRQATIAANRRFESAEAEVERLREGIRALADEWGSGVVARLTADHAAAELRALLAHPPAATTGEARCYGSGARCDEHGGRWDGTGRCLRADVNPPPAPVSSGEADPMPCDNCGTSEADCPGLPESATCCGKLCFHSRSSGEAATGEAACGKDLGDTYVCRCLLDRGHSGMHQCRHFAGPAPVVTPSAEGSE